MWCVTPSFNYSEKLSEYVNVCAGACVGVYEGENSSSLFLADIPVFIKFIMIYLKVQYMIY